MNQEEILKHIKIHATTGIIHDALIPYFDQDGKWRGDMIRWKCDTSKPCLAKIQTSLLPSSRRTRRERSGTVLRTSFYWTGPECVHVTYSGIEGSFVVGNKNSIHAPSLRHVGGHFTTGTNQRIHLPNLQTVGGDFLAMETFLLEAPRLRHVAGKVMLIGTLPPSLETVGKHLAVYWLFAFDAPRLRHIGGSLVLSKVEQVRLPVLEAVGCSILLGSHAHKFHAPKLRSTGNDFLMGSVSQIKAPRLRFVGGDLDTHSSKAFYHPDIKVMGQWAMHPEAAEYWTMRQAARLAMRGDREPPYL